MTEKRLILHVGTHKTGTSSFQMALRRNAGALRERGIRPIPAPRFENGERVRGKRFNNSFIAHLLIRPELRTGARYRGIYPEWTGPQRQRRLMRLAERLAGMEEDTLIVSAEGLCFLRTEAERKRLSEFLGQVGRRVESFVVFRNDAAWRESWLAQLSDHEDLLDKVRAEPEDRTILGDWYFDKEAIRQFWSPFNLAELRYEDHPNIIPALLERMGIGQEGLDLDLRRNVRSG